MIFFLSGLECLMSATILVSRLDLFSQSGVVTEVRPGVSLVGEHLLLLGLKTNY